MTTSERDRFYRLRDQRSVAYGASETALDRFVGIVAEPRIAELGPVQVALLSVANMMARVHRRLAVQVPDVPLVRPSMFGGNASLREAIVEAILAINPFAEVELRAPTADEPSIGAGDAGATVSVGFDGPTAFVSSQAQPALGKGRPATLGASLAACLGAAELYKIAHGESLRASSFSVWQLVGLDWTSGPDHLPRLNVGDVAVVGAGAVSSALAYWLSDVGHEGDWLVLDGDAVELHNTNRSLAFTAADAGWPAGPARAKVDVVAPLLGGRGLPLWYDEWVRREPAARPDLILPLANEQGVREAIGQRGLPVILHATTSRAWQAQLHQHIVGRDDCIGCRFPSAQPKFECSAGPVLNRSDNGRSDGDAALPFLSATAGLLLLVGLYRLTLSEDPARASPKNLRWVSFDGGPSRFGAARASCGSACSAPSVALVRRVSAGNRWLRLVAGE